MLMGAGGVALAISTIVQSVVKLELVSVLGQRRITRMMSKLRDHYVICGSGRVGSQLIRDLLAQNQTCVAIENDQRRAAAMTELGLTVLVGDATLEDTLRNVGIERARGLAACLPNDADNVYVVLTARDLNPNLRIVARAVEQQGETKLMRAGADHVVAPTIIGGHRLALALTKPIVSAFVNAFTEHELALRFEECEVADDSLMAGEPLDSVLSRPDVDVVIMSIRRPDGEIVFNPPREFTVKSGDILIAIGRAESLIKLSHLASAER
jgi:voltage-gated potassium channel